MKRCLTSFIKKNSNLNQNVILYNSIRLAKMKTFDSALCWPTCKDVGSLILCWWGCNLPQPSWRAFGSMHHDFRSHVIWPSNFTCSNLSYRYIHKYMRWRAQEYGLQHCKNRSLETTSTLILSVGNSLASCQLFFICFLFFPLYLTTACPHYLAHLDYLPGPLHMREPFGGFWWPPGLCPSFFVFLLGTSLLALPPTPNLSLWILLQLKKLFLM